MSSRSLPSEKELLHPRNRHRGRYDFPALIEANPELGRFVAPTGYGHDSIDFANPVASKALNRALLRRSYEIEAWDIPDGYLCPPIPGRADYVHHAADLLGRVADGAIPQGGGIRVLDVGVGSSCVYPIIGRYDYGWSFVGTDIDKTALRNAQKIAAKNPRTLSGVEFRLQASPAKILAGMIQPGERFDLTMSNPPFFASLEEAEAGTRRKAKYLLGKPATEEPSSFAGKRHELWCRGGELGFITRMIGESAPLGRQCLWFTSLLSKSNHLRAVQSALKSARAAEVQVVDMAQGQKKSRIVAWTFLAPAEQRAWAKERFLLGRA